MAYQNLKCFWVNYGEHNSNLFGLRMFKITLKSIIFLYNLKLCNCRVKIFLQLKQFLYKVKLFNKNIKIQKMYLQR